MRPKYCTFCGKERSAVQQLIDGPADNFICNECIDLLHEMIHGTLPPPGTLAIELDKRRRLGLPTEPAKAEEKQT